MNFKEATDVLFNGVSQGELARILGISVASIRQARLKSSAKAHRAPPENWEEGVVKLAAERIRSYQRLISKLYGGRQASLPLSGSAE
jgi:hypothetical protein